ncbi:MAG: putative beta-lysine N-acetyltransferase [Bacteroidota bacterium]|nr:putative beta-lysine N-acetyltransferase [Bacteroidota bacterium]
MNDKIEILEHGSLIQHGKHNDRIYLMKLKEKDVPSILKILSKLAIEYRYTKIFCKIPKWAAPLFYSNGFLLEASIPRFYNNQEDVFFVSKFLSSDRLLDIENSQLQKLSKLLLEKSKTIKSSKKAVSEFKVKRLVKTDVESITKIYTEIFLSYPFPIHNPGYILNTMDENVQYYGVEVDGKLAAIASSEIDKKGQNAEMTDFATSIAFQGNKLSTLLLDAMEKDMKEQGISTLYTIARLKSIPMNKTFLRFDYSYSGTLIKNTNIAGNIESMNVYYKHI